ncbi:MAG: AAA family ATPase [Rhodospirillaceae bacterium]|nr:AAA family ATPase [Rhodospirillaceae bacterium]
MDTSDSIIPSSTGGDFLSHGDTPGAMEFLGWFRPKGWMNLVAIPQDTGPPIGITRSTGDPDLESFITKHNGKKNLYFMVNEPRPDAPDKKLSKDDVALIHATQTDIDPVKGEPFKIERKRIDVATQKLLGKKLPPSFVIHSGGGDQHFWLLEKPIKAQKNRERAETVGKHLASQIGGDAVQNIDRIMRLPGTVNLPNKVKRQNGQKKALAFLKVKTNQLYSLDQFRELGRLEKRPQKSSPNYSDDEIELWTLDSELAELIEAGVPEGERSEEFFHAVGWLKDTGHSAEAIFDLLMEYPNGIAEKYYSRSAGDLQKQVDVCFDKAEERENPKATYSEDNFEGLKLLTLSEMAARPPMKFLVPGLFPEKGVALLAGQSGMMKSFGAISIGLAAATGGILFDREIKQTNCLYMLNEGQGGFGRRCAAWLKHHDMESPDTFRVTEATPNLMRAKSLEPFVELIKAENFNPGLIILDTFSKATIGGDDNSTKDMAMAMSNAYEIAKQFDALVILIDHMGKDKSRGVRGAYAKHAAADMVGFVSKVGGAVTIKTAKQKEAEDNQEFDFNIEQVKIDGESVAVLVPVQFHEKNTSPQGTFIIDILEGSVEELNRDQLGSKFLEEYGDDKKGSYKTQLNRLIRSKIVQENGDKLTVNTL